MIVATVSMTQESCCICHMIFWMPESFRNQCREQKPRKSLWCPAGHAQHYPGESDLDQERRLRQRAQQDNARLAEEVVEAERQKQKAEKKLAQHVKRTTAGVCPCCQRTFGQLAKHMKTKHPNYGTNVVALKA